MALNYLFLTMEIARLNYLGDFKCEIQHLSSGDCICTDAPKDNNGEGLHTSPTDLLAMALASCMITVVAIKFKKEYQNDLPNAILSISKIMLAQPRRVSKIEVQCKFNAFNCNDVQQQQIISWAHECPVALSLHPDTQIVFNVIWN
jgi:putative redox protein